jgi:type I restriction enzyme M protein
MHFTLKTNPLKRSDLDEFVKCYHGEHTAPGDPGAPGPGKSNLKRKLLDGRSTTLSGTATRQKRKPTFHADKSPDGRWRCFTYDELEKRDKLNLGIFWLRDKSLEDSDDLPEPVVLAQEIADDLQTAQDQFAAIAAGLRK